MSEKGAPRQGSGPNKTPMRADLDRLIADCIADPNEWYSMLQPDGTATNSAKSAVRVAVQAAVTDVAIKDGRIYLRYHGGQK